MTTQTTTDTAPTNGAAKSAPAQTQAITTTTSGDHALNAFAGADAFGVAQRMAKLLSSSSMVPQAYQNRVDNCVIALELASRTKASVFAVMQNLDIIHGRPSWRAQFLIATVNSCGLFTPLRYEWSGKPGTDTYGCRAVAKDRKTGEALVGTLITIALAKAEGWYSRNGSKWKTMPEQMLMYRAASFWTRAYAPDLSLGMQTREEVIDTWGEAAPEKSAPAELLPGSTAALEAALLGHAAQAAQVVTADGEVIDHEREPGEDDV